MWKDNYKSFIWCSWNIIEVIIKYLKIETMSFKSHNYVCKVSVQFSSDAVVSDTLRPHEPQHARPPCPSSTPGVHPNPCPLSWWCHPTISSSVSPFSSCPQSFPVSGSFQMSQLCIRGPKYWSFSFNISPSNEYSGLLGSPCSPRNSQESSPTPQFKSISSLVLSFLYSPTLTSIHDYWENHSLD